MVISTNVVNEGDEAGNYSVVLKINGQVEQQKMVSVGPRMANPVNFTVVKTEPGIYKVTIDNEQISFSVVPVETSKNVNGNVIIAIISSIIILMIVTILMLVWRRFEYS